MGLSHIFWALGALISYFYLKPLVINIWNYRSHRKFAREHGCLPPKVTVPAVIFPFSLLRMLDFWRAAAAKRHINFLHDLVHKYGTTRVYTSALMNEIVVITCDPEIIKTVLATSFHDFQLGKARHDAFSDLLGDGIFTTDGELWGHARALLRPQFTKDQIADLEDLEIHFQNLLAILSPQEGEVVRLHKLFLSYTLDSSTNLLFGQSVHSLLQKMPGGDNRGISGSDLTEHQNFEAAFDFAQDALGFRLAIWDFRFFYRPRGLKESIAVIHGFVDKLVSRAIQRSQDEKVTKERKYIFLEALAQDTQDPKVLRDQSLSAMLAGRDTTATLLSWTFWLLSKNPRVWKKLREEVLNEIGQELPTYQQLKDAKYLKWVINETLRLFPVLPVNFRVSTKDAALPVGGGPDGRSPIFISKGSRVIYSVYALHRRKDIYGEDAEEFRPERWGEDAPRGWDYLPFNGGPRICIGQQLALITASYTIVRLLQTFERIEDADPSELVLSNLTLTLSPANETPVRLYRDPNRRC